MVGLLLELHMFLLLAASAPLLNDAQREGFISIDCGAAEGTNYTDEVTGIAYTSDAAYIFTGENKGVSPSITTPYNFFKTARSFPEGDRNCYTLKPVRKGHKYLVRTSFLYDNFDGIEEIPQYDLYLGVSFWTSVDLPGPAEIWSYEIITMAKNDFIDVCLVRRVGNPFISALELRPLDPDTYNGATGSQDLRRQNRYDIRSLAIIPIGRYKDDPYDRNWETLNVSNGQEMMNGNSIDTNKDTNVYRPPREIMSDGVIPLINFSSTINFTWQAEEKIQYLVYAHVRDLESTRTELVREFTACIQGSRQGLSSSPPTCLGPFRTNYSSTITINSSFPVTGNDQYVYYLQRTALSDLPPILNALEIYKVIQHGRDIPTNEGDLNAIMAVRSFHGIKKNWMGDPCAPPIYIWEGLTCHTAADIAREPRITHLNLSASGLHGSISPSIGNLSSLESLDLSKNDLSGELPDFLAALPSLKLINLSENYFTGSIPSDLLRKWNNGSLQLSVEGNPELCKSFSCNSSKKKPKLMIFILVPVTAVVIFLGITFGLWKTLGKRKMKGTRQAFEKSRAMDTSSSSFNLDNRRYTYAELVDITDNFSRDRLLGKGGFATVYHGISKDGNQVAVKRMSHNCNGSSETFQTEAQLLTRVSHKNLVRFIGYCVDGKNKALVLEYMPKGSLDKVLFGSNDNDNKVILTWGQRLRIAQDIALGLEYLHVGCKPPIIHRDVKLANVLLNDNFEAKIADFGISKVFHDHENCTHASTTDVKGTPGYLDPEYYAMHKLNEKSDVYAFGVILLELITGKPAIIQISDEERITIVKWVRNQMSRGDLKSILDPRLEGDWDSNSVWMVMAIEVAIESSQERCLERPSMSDVVTQLKECLGRVDQKASSRSGSFKYTHSGTDLMSLPTSR